jgi:hypothetical protein
MFEYGFRWNLLFRCSCWTQVAQRVLTNMQICDICYFPEYAREYEKYYLKLGDVQSPVFGCLYFFKLSVSDKRKRNMY